MTEVLKVLIAKETLDQMRSELKDLRAFKEAHSSGSHALAKEGSGECSENNVDPCSETNNCQCQKNDDSFNEDFNQVLPTEPPKVNVISEKDESSIDHFPTELITSKIWKRFHYKAKLLLTELENCPDFKMDKFSMVSINNIPLHLSIFQILKATFHPVKKDLNKYAPYVKLLKDLKLEKYVTNRYLLVDDQQANDNSLSPYWYYIA